jgi:organic hydroperoxide reductase OsmC/OhrA
MQISAIVTSDASGHRVRVATAGTTQSLAVPAKVGGRGSAVNGGEFLMLALATCYCNDIYREAARLAMAIDAVEVEAQAVFAGIGLAATDISYTARITSSASAEDIERLLRETDAVAEVHNTVRAGVPVRLVSSAG